MSRGFEPLPTASGCVSPGVGERTVVRVLEAGVGERPTLEWLMDALKREGLLFLVFADGHGPGFRLPMKLIKRDDLRF